MAQPTLFPSPVLNYTTYCTVTPPVPSPPALLLGIYCRTNRNKLAAIRLLDCCQPLCKWSDIYRRRWLLLTCSVFHFCPGWKSQRPVKNDNVVVSLAPKGEFLKNASKRRLTRCFPMQLVKSLSRHEQRGWKKAAEDLRPWTTICKLQIWIPLWLFFGQMAIAVWTMCGKCFLFLFCWKIASNFSASAKERRFLQSTLAWSRSECGAMCCGRMRVSYWCGKSFTKMDAHCPSG